MLDFIAQMQDHDDTYLDGDYTVAYTLVAGDGASASYGARGTNNVVVHRQVMLPNAKSTDVLAFMEGIVTAAQKEHDDIHVTFETEKSPADFIIMYSFPHKAGWSRALVLGGTSHVVDDYIPEFEYDDDWDDDYEEEV